MSCRDNVCILISGGVDSAVLLADALARGRAVYPVYVACGHYWESAEKFWVHRFLKSLSSPALKSLKILELPMRDVYGSHWSFTGKNVPGLRSSDKAVYLPGRNALLTAKAAGWAARRDISSIEIGVLKGNPFSDSTPLFFQKMSDALSLALGRKIRIESPFRHLTKSQVVLKAKKLNVNLVLTFSCIHPNGVKPCGKCNKCAERAKANVPPPDPVPRRHVR